MTIVIIGGSGLIGSKVVARLREQGAELGERTSVASDRASIGKIRLDDWLGQGRRYER